MQTIQIDFDVYKALTVRRSSEDVTYNDVLREMLGLEPGKKNPSSSLMSSRNSFTCQGKVFSAPSSSKAMRDIFRFFAGRDATFLERFAAHKHGRKRRYIARDQAELYPGRPDLRKHSLEIIPGWWIGTNYSTENMEEIVRLAEEVAGSAVQA
jgi:negative regulator of replication initiation